MTREKQTAMQFSSWITKDRWDPLLNWFNQNDSDDASWTTFFDEAQKYDIQEKWPRYIDFFEKHLENKSCKTVSFVSHSDAQRRSWKVFAAAFPTFFVKAAPLLSPAQRKELKGKAMEWMTPWLYEKEHLESFDANKCFFTAFGILISLDAMEEWNSIKHLMHSAYISNMLKHTAGKDLQWVHGLRELHVADGKSLSSWRVTLLKTDCVEHLSAEGTAFPVTHALLDYAGQHDQTLTLDVAVWSVFKRLPYFRVWVEQASGEDAQACRAVLGIPEFDIDKSSVAKTIDIGKNLGLGLKDVTCLLDAATVKLDDMVVDAHVFEEILSDSSALQK